MAGTLLRDILELDLLKNAILLAGKNSIDRIVVDVTVAEVPDISNWVKPNTLYLSTLFNFQEPETQKELVISLARAGAAGLIIKTKRFLNETPEALIETAEKLSFPVIEIEPQIKWSELIRIILERIIQAEKELSEEKRLMNVILERRDELDEISTTIKKSGIDISAGLRAAVVLLDFNEMQSLPDADAYAARLKSFFRRLKIRNLTSIYEDRIVAIFNDKDLEKFVAAFSRSNETLDTLKASYPFIAIGILAGSIKELKKSLKTAQAAGKIAKKLRLRQPLIIYDSIRHYDLILNNIDEQSANELIDSTLAGLIDYDNKHNSELLDTLIAFFENNRNKVKTAESLHIHLNTLKYRLKKIQELLGSDIDDSETAFKLEFCLRLFRLFRQKSDLI